MSFSNTFVAVYFGPADTLSSRLFPTAELIVKAPNDFKSMAGRTERFENMAFARRLATSATTDTH